MKTENGTESTQLVKPDYREDELVSEAVSFINEKTILSGIDLAKTIGAYVLETFFGGDYENFRDPSRIKATSFRSLLAREDLLIGNSTLYAFVRISQQVKYLPSDVASRITLAHHRALLPLPDPDMKLSLAQRALEENWPSRKLACEVRKMLPQSRSGRKPLPFFAKGISRLVKAVEIATQQELTVGDVDRFGREQSAELMEQVKESLARLETLEKSLESLLSVGD